MLGPLPLPRVPRDEAHPRPMLKHKSFPADNVCAGAKAAIGGLPWFGRPFGSRRGIEREETRRSWQQGRARRPSEGASDHGSSRNVKAEGSRAVDLEKGNPDLQDGAEAVLREAL